MLQKSRNRPVLFKGNRSFLLIMMIHHITLSPIHERLKKVYLGSMISLMAVLSSPSINMSVKAGIHIKSTPPGATNPLAIATAFTA